MAGVPMMTVERRRGRPLTSESRGLRVRAWWLMRQVGKFTIDDLLNTLATGDERDAGSNVRKFLVKLERAGILKRLQRRVPGYAATSNGRRLWVVQRDLGPRAPICRADGVFDPNSATTLPYLIATKGCLP